MQFYWWRKGDLDGFFGLFVDNLIQLIYRCVVRCDPEYAGGDGARTHSAGGCREFVNRQSVLCLSGPRLGAGNRTSSGKRSEHTRLNIERNNSWGNR